MRAVICPDRAGGSCGRRLVRGALVCCVYLTFFVLAVPSFGYWLPWAKEEDKIVRRLNEIWAAVLLGDTKMLRMYLVGDGAQNFIDQEIDYANRMKIKSYLLRVDKAQFDPVSRQFAFVETTRTATGEDGHTKTDRTLKVLKKVDDDWKLVVDVIPPGKKHDKNIGKPAVLTESGSLHRDRSPSR